MAHEATSAPDVKTLKLDTTPWRVPSPHKSHDPADDTRPLHPLYYDRPGALSPDVDFIDVASEQLLEGQPPVSRGRVSNDGADSDDGLSLPERKRASPRRQEGEGTGPARRRDRRSSVTFNPTATLDCGTQHDIDAPVSRTASRNNQPGQPRVRGRSMMDEFAMAVQQRTRPRNHSESERDQYSSSTGEKIQEPRRSRREQPRYRVGEGRFPLLQATVDQLAREKSERRGSVTSDSSWSQVLEGTSSPQDAQLSIRLPSNISTAATDPLSLHRSGTFSGVSPALESGLRLSNRSLSYYMDRKGSMRRQMTGSMRSPSSSMSPAGSFLTQWMRDDASTTVDPDDEGQEICGDSGYIIGRQIGYGGFSVVKEVYRLDGDERNVRAVKIVRKNLANRSEAANEHAQAEFEHEVSIWRHLQHQHILPLLAVFHDSFATYCIMNLYTGGTLFDLVASRRKLARTNSSLSTSSHAPDPTAQGILPELAKRYISHLASAVRYLHRDARIVHRDIKLENCLLNSASNTVLLCDFGMADFISSDDRDAFPAHDANPHSIGPGPASSVITGSVAYASPEHFDASHSPFLTESDMWAVGVCCYTLLTGQLPFSHTFAPRLQMLIAKGEWDVDALGREGGEDAVEMVGGCLETDVGKRWSVEKLLACNYLSGASTL